MQKLKKAQDIGQLQTEVENELKGLLQTVEMCQSQLSDHQEPYKLLKTLQRLEELLMAVDTFVKNTNSQRSTQSENEEEIRASDGQPVTPAHPVSNNDDKTCFKRPHSTVSALEAPKKRIKVADLVPVTGDKTLSLSQSSCSLLAATGSLARQKRKGRQVHMAYMNAVAKPPDSLSLQEKFSTANADPIPVKSHRSFISCPESSSCLAPRSSSSQGSMKKAQAQRIAPLMAKAYKDYKNRFLHR